MTFKLANYAMGRAVETATVEAGSYDEAVRIADATFRGAHGLPGTVQQAASKSRVIGIRLVAA